MGGFCKSLQLGPFRRYQGKQLQFKGGNSELFLFEKMTWSLPASKLASGNGREVGNLNKKKKKTTGKKEQISEMLFYIDRALLLWFSRHHLFFISL